MTQNELKKLVHYKPDTGVFTRLMGTGKGAAAGSIAGSLDKQSGYVQLWVGRKHYRAHRLAWFYMTGEWPSLIDHVNGEKADNRWANLRVANHSKNSANQREKAFRALPKGVYQYDYTNGGKPYAQIRVNGKTIHLGAYQNTGEAKAAYNRAAAREFGEFANLGPSTTIPAGSTLKRAEVAGARE